MIHSDIINLKHNLEEEFKNVHLTLSQTNLINSGEWNVEILNSIKRNLYFKVFNRLETFFVKLNREKNFYFECSCYERKCDHILHFLNLADLYNDEFVEKFNHFDKPDDLNSFLAEKINAYYSKWSYYSNFYEYTKIYSAIQKSKKQYIEFGKDYLIFVIEIEKITSHFCFCLDYNNNDNDKIVVLYSEELDPNENKALIEYIKEIINFKKYRDFVNCSKYGEIASQLKKELFTLANKPKSLEDFIAEPNFMVKKESVSISPTTNEKSLLIDFLTDSGFYDSHRKKPEAVIGFEFVYSKYDEPYFKPFIQKLLKSGLPSKTQMRCSNENFEKMNIKNLTSKQKEYALQYDLLKKFDVSSSNFAPASFSLLYDEFEKIDDNRIFYSDSKNNLFPLNISKANKLNLYPKFLDIEGKTIGFIASYKKDDSDQWKYFSGEFIINNKEQYIYSLEDHELLFFNRDSEAFKRYFPISNVFAKFNTNDFQNAVITLKSIAELDPENFTIEETFPELSIIKIKPEVILTIVNSDLTNELTVQLTFDNKSIVEKSIKAKKGDKSSVIIEDSRYKEDVFNFLCNQESLIYKKAYFPKSLKQDEDITFVILRDNLTDWLKTTGIKLIEKGFTIYFDKNRRKIDSISTVNISTKTNIKWFEYDVTVEDSNGILTSIKEFDFITHTAIDNNGLIHILDVKDLDRVQRLIKYSEPTKDGFRVPASNFVLINELYDKRDTISDDLQKSIDRAKKLEEFENTNYAAPKNFKGTLRNYQLAGYQWLRFLNEYEFNGCLADDMGLGKTVQTLSLLQHLKNSKKLGKILLVVPVSAIANWENEITKFTKNISSKRHIGTNRSYEDKGNEDITITSYQTLRNDIEFFQNIDFNYIILDESQNIKNLNAQTTKAVKLIKSRYRIALSGTPIENNLMELWSLFDFLMPGYLGTHHWFKQNYISSDDGSVTNSELLKRMIFPFMLRRKKADVEIDLPPKNELTVAVEMGDEQKEIYSKTAKFYQDLITKEIKDDSIESSSMKVLEGMLRLRQICLFPDIVDEKFKDVRSAKFDEFSEMLFDVINEGHKVLFFSQFVEVLSRVEKSLQVKKISYSYIDGSTPINKREKAINDFQKDKKNQIFLLSIKAGGTALNLTEADYVFIYDPWWNPAVENQAVDRAHRFGQKKSVFVYRFVVKDSIEEKIINLQNMKKELVDNIVSSDKGVFKSLSKSDIIGLFK